MQKCIQEFFDNRIPVRTKMKLSMRTNGEFLIMMDLTRRDICFFNRTAKKIYDLCDNKLNVRDIILTLKKHYTTIPEETLQKDVYEIK